MSLTINFSEVWFQKSLLHNKEITSLAAEVIKLLKQPLENFRGWKVNFIKVYLHFCEVFLLPSCEPERPRDTEGAVGKNGPIKAA